ncbi:FAD-binding oxidoreductase [Nocardia yunnanensis]|uniref:FAD-binding oxidoreductase n=1 Tax=Nocardia yunnanensis TaxID=2382165 RepID=A0A386ZK03_9NOCA|nr:FAD-binding oxidoreductase [Nocardia yunnanensis]AYF77891.1 FAD-binding oxidoreductase [Nocardia yunnanensis]
MSNLRELRSVIRGRVLLVGDNGFDAARTPWNLAVAQPVSAVVEAADADDVAALVRFAASAGYPIAAQPSGHGATGDNAGAILLRTGALDELEVDPIARTARVGAGVAAGRVQAAASKHGLTGLPGSSPVVTTAAYTLGGGLSWFGRKHGWAADSVIAFEVIDADGHRARVTAETDPDLFWALRGGGGDFALVTAVELTLFPEPRLYGGRMLWSADRAPAVLSAFREITATAPDALTVWAELLQFPGADPLVALDVTYLGDPDEARELLAVLDGIDGLIGDTRAVMPISELGTITAEPTDPGPGLSYAALLTDVDEVVINELLATPIDPLLSVQIRHLGGALVRPSDSPHGPLVEPYALYLFGLPLTPEKTAALHAKRADLIDALASYAVDRKPFTFLAPDESITAAFAPEAVARLRQIKRDRDPRGVFRSNFPVLG